MNAKQQMSPLKRFVGVRVFPAMLILMGSVSIYLGLQTTQYAKDSLDWPVTKAKIAKSGVELETTTSNSTGSLSTSRTYRAIVEYEFSVEGKSFQGNRIAYGHYDTEDAVDAERTIEAFPVGAIVDVSYLPDNPLESVLKPGDAGAPWFFIILGGVFLFVGLVMARYFPRMFKATS
jgi:hypothetical protein